MPIITTAEFKTYAGITGTALDARLNAIIPAVQDEFERACGRRFDQATYTDILDGHGTGVLVLRNPPIAGTVTIATVRSDGTASTLYSGTVANGQLVGHPGVKVDTDNGTIELDAASMALAVSSEWPMAYATVIAPSWRGAPLQYAVTYTGGYASAPPALKHAMYEMVGAALAVAERRGNTTLRSESLGNYAYTVAEAGTPDDVVQRHARAWRRRWS